MKPYLRVLVIGTALALGGCQYYTLAEAGKPVLVAETYNVTPDSNWSRHVSGNVEQWTIDGPLLQELTFYSNIEDGKPLAPDQYWLGAGNSQKEGKPPAFDSKMTELEVAELVKETYMRAGLQNFAVANLHPARFGGIDGFRFEFTYDTKEGLAKKGMASGAVVSDKLHIAIYNGTKRYYFTKYKDAVDQMLASLKFTEG